MMAFSSFNLSAFGRIQRILAASARHGQDKG